MRAHTSTLRWLGGSRITIAIVVAFGLGVATQAAAQYSIPWYTIDGGGGTSTGGTYTLSGTIGQPDPGPTLVGSPYSLIGGFWAIIASGGTAGGLRGDANNDGVINVSDVFYLINALFAGGPSPASLCLGDANNDLVMNVSDVFYLINFLFAGGPAPNPPNC